MFALIFITSNYYRRPLYDEIVRSRLKSRRKKTHLFAALFHEILALFPSQRVTNCWPCKERKGLFWGLRLSKNVLKNWAEGGVITTLREKKQLQNMTSQAKIHRRTLNRKSYQLRNNCMARKTSHKRYVTCWRTIINKPSRLITPLVVHESECWELFWIRNRQGIDGGKESVAKRAYGWTGQPGASRSSPPTRRLSKRVSW